MRTRTFIGMILLVLALFVVSVPSLLDLASGGVQAAAHKAGVPGVEAVRPANQKFASSKAADDGTVQLNDGLEIKGYEADGDNLRDGYSTAERESIGNGRLKMGSTRQELPDQLRNGTITSSPIPTGTGILLDSDGCPTFAKNANPTELMADPDVAQRYDDGVANADEPGACRTTFDARVAAGEPSDDDTTQRIIDELGPAAIERMDPTEMLILVAYYDMFEDMFGSTLGSDATDTAATTEPTATTAGAAG